MDLARDTKIIFYCALPNEGSAAGLADKYNRGGFTNIKALKDGVEGWKNAWFQVWQEGCVLKQRYI